MQHLRDPVYMPGTGESPQGLLSKALPLTGTLGKNYVEKRSIPSAIAHTRVAFDSIIEQGALFCHMLKENRK
jgi:hypothetical protein